MTEFWIERREIWPLRVSGDTGRFGSGYSAISRGLGGDSGISHPYAHVSQLNDKEGSLSGGDDNQAKGECRNGVCRNLLPEGFLLFLLCAACGGFIGGLGLCYLLGLWPINEKHSSRENSDRQKAP